MMTCRQLVELLIDFVSGDLPAEYCEHIQQHLNRCGVSLRDLVWQTDNGREFKGDFPKALGDSQHVRIPPAAHTRAM